MVVPLSKGPLPDSRTNIAAEVPTFLVSGVTSRAEVLLRLGEPDGAADHDRQFIYMKRVRTSGHGTFLCAQGGCLIWTTEGMLYDRLTIQFDEQNKVASSKHEQISCTEETDSWNREAMPCMNTNNLELTRKSHDFVFSHAVWCRGVLLNGWTLDHKGAPIDCPRGNLVIGDAEILLYSGAANNRSEPTIALPYAEISSVEKIADIFATTGIAVKRVDQIIDSITIEHEWSKVADGHSVKRALELLLSRVKAVPAK
jgi:hypothetical protein